MASWSFIWILVAANFVSIHGRAPLSLRIGSVFPVEASVSNLGLGIQQSFRQVVRHINADKTILNNTRVDTDIQFAETDQYDAYQKICTEMQYSVMAVFGSSPSVVDSSVGSICSALHIPYLTTGGLGAHVAPSNGQFVVRVGPQARDLVNAAEALLKKLEWNEVAYVVHRKTASLDVSILIESCKLAA